MFSAATRCHSTKSQQFFLCDAIMMTLMSSHQILDKHTMVDDTDVISPNP